MRWGVYVLALVVPFATQAQDRAATLADIRLQLKTLSSEIAALRGELTATGTAGPTFTGAPLERLDGLEDELRQITAKTEELQFRIDQVVTDGTNRIGDLEFRLTELEGGDLGALNQTPPLGGTSATAPLVMMPPASDPELAVGERADFDAAQIALTGGDAAGALAILDQFQVNYPQSPLSSAAELARGQALTLMELRSDAGRAYLKAFTEAEVDNPEVASAALLGLGRTLKDLGQPQEACRTLGMIGTRYPGYPAVAEADATLAQMTCP